VVAIERSKADSSLQRRRTLETDEDVFPVPSGRYEKSVTIVRQPLDLEVGFKELEVSCVPEQRALWCYLKPDGRPSFTPTLLRELRSLHARIRKFQSEPDPTQAPLLYYVQGSRTPGIYNMGGDFRFMVDCIKRQDREALRDYAYDCIEAVHNISTGFGGPVISICLLEGDALGGGLEGALCCNMLIAERSKKFGLPEILFNSFPGMGAYSFLSRKIGVRKTESMILSGRIYTAEEMHELGVIDLVVDDGKGKEAVLEYISAETPSHNIRSTLFQVRNCVNPVTLAELRSVTELWVEAVLRSTEGDLRKKCVLEAAQARRLARQKS
jgi:DSF synthase